ncbi:MAG: hypothetical protein LPJ94_14035 [Thauera sp.]|nr:hypothetical protein [Pseudazoarcus pumilus]MDX5411340.1 hypothetical protein [Thauera sp.]
MLPLTPAQRVHAVCAFVVPIVLVLMAAWSLPQASSRQVEACADVAAFANDTPQARQACVEALSDSGRTTTLR